MLDQDVQNKFTGYDTALAQIVSNALTLGFKNDGTTDNLPKLQNIQSNSRVFFPSGTYYFNNTALSILTLNNVELFGTPNTLFLFDSTKQFMQFLNSSNITIRSIQMKDISYTDAVYFTQVTMPAPTTNTNANIDVTINGMSLSIAKNASTPQGTEQKYIYTITLDQTKEYMFELFEGLFSTNSYDHINITRYFVGGGTQTDLLNLQVATNGHQGQYRWLANYIPTGVTKVDLEFCYMYAWNTLAPTINIDLTKIKLYQATKPLPDSIDDFCIQFKNSSNIVIDNNTFTGIQHTLFTNNGAVSNVTYKNNGFYNCFNSNIDLSLCTHGYAYNNRIYRNILTADGQDVLYGKCSTRGIAVNTSSDIQILNNYIEGTYFGTEIHSTTDLLIEGNKIKNTHWGHSLVNGTIGKVVNENYSLRYGWRFAVEIAVSSLVDVNGLTVKGDSFQGFVLSLTDNKAGYTMNFSNFKIDKTFALVQYNQDGFDIQNVVVNELHGVGILLLPNASYSPTNTQVKLTNVIFTMSPSYVVVSQGYVFTHLSLWPSSGFLDKIVLRDCRFIGGSPNKNFALYAKNLVLDNFSSKDASASPNVISIDTTVTDRLTVIRNSHINKMTISADYASVAKMIFNNNVLLTCTLPSTAIKQNNVIDGVWTA